MPTVNFLADPHEWVSPRGLKHLDEAWLVNYERFKGRLNWLLLWNDEVRILDSFVLFNRQIERWVQSAQQSSRTRSALERLFNSDAFRVALRSGDGKRTFSTLQEIDAAHMRGNKDFRWYYDGPPSQNFIKLMDAYLGLPSATYSIRYEGTSFGPRMAAYFDAAFDRTTTLEGIYEEFADLREKMPADAPERLRNLTEGAWRRSTLYTILGFGIDEHGDPLPASPNVSDFSEPVRNRFRTLVDSVWHRTIHQNLAIPTRYPGEPPAPAFWQPSQSSAANVLGRTDQDAEWINSVLMDKQVGAAHIEGDVGLLFGRIATLDVAEVSGLREHSVLKEYRQKYSDFEAQGAKAFADAQLLNELARVTVSGLRQVGAAVGVEIKEVGHGPATVRLLSGHVAPKLFAYGMAILVGDPTIHGHQLPLQGALKAVGLDQGIRWLATKFVDVGTPSKPLELKATYVGPVQS